MKHTLELVIPATQETKARQSWAHRLSGWHGELKTSLGGLARPCLKTNIKRCGYRSNGRVLGSIPRTHTHTQYHTYIYYTCIYTHIHTTIHFTHTHITSHIHMYIKHIHTTHAHTYTTQVYTHHTYTHIPHIYMRTHIHTHKQYIYFINLCFPASRVSHKDRDMCIGFFPVSHHWHHQAFRQIVNIRALWNTQSLSPLLSSITVTANQP